MRTIIQFLIIVLFLVSNCIAGDKSKSYYVYLQDPNDLINTDNFYEYQIIKNDYLSKIAYRFYGNGLKWNKIYIANPYIIDPDWIYPNNWLVIPDIYKNMDGNPSKTKETFLCQSDEELTKQITAPIKPDTTLPVIKPKIEPTRSEPTAVKPSKTKETFLYQSDDELIKQITTSIKPDTTLSVIKPKIEPIRSKPTVVKPIKAITNTSISTTDSDSTKIYIFSRNNPNWILGLYGGYPFGDIPSKDDNMVFGALVGTPLRIKVGPLGARLGLGILGFNHTNKFYPGAGIYMYLSVGDLLKIDMPLKFQVNGTGFYWPPSEENGYGILASASVPIGKSPFDIGIFAGIGEYNNANNKNSTWKNMGIMLQLLL